MASSRSLSPSLGINYGEELQEVIEHLMLQPDREPVASELQVLQSIYGEDSIQLWHSPEESEADSSIKPGSIRYEAILSFPPPHEDVSIRVLCSLPPSYPATSPPQLQLLSRYIGAFGADSNLFGAVLRTYISVNGVEWTEDTVCVFDGLQNVLDRCVAWYEDHLSTVKAEELVREDARDHDHADTQSHAHSPSPPTSHSTAVEQQQSTIPKTLGIPDGLEIFQAEAIIDRKSVFIGRACRISHPSQVPVILAYIISDRRIARAHHPAINAWRCQVDNLLYQDNDDDAEPAAGGRLAHLLQILDCNNVLVAVTRFWGGTRLGPDRFKHINQAARNALELGGFLDDGTMTTKKQSGRKKH